MKYKWQDLPKDLNLFTKRSAIMRDLDTGKIMQYYATNTKIVVVQKCITQKNTYYRTRTAAVKDLNWAFEASVFGLPNEAAPPAPTQSPSSPKKVKKPDTRTLTKPAIKQKSVQKAKSPKGGGGSKPTFFKKLTRFFHKMV